MSYVSFEDFVKSRRWVSSLRAECEGFGDEDSDMPGFVYMNEFFIYDNMRLKDKSIPPYSWVVGNSCGNGEQIAHCEREFYDAIKGFERWSDTVLIELRYTIKVPRYFDKRAIDGILEYGQDALGDNFEGAQAYEIESSEWSYGPQI